MTRPAWETLTPEQQRAEWERFNAWQAAHSQPASVSPGPPRRRIDPWPVFAGVICTVTVLIFVIIAAMPGNTDVTGDVTVLGNTTASISGAGGNCSTYGGYNDIAQGASVTVRDATDSIVGIGSLNAGTASSGTCVFTFSVPDVPESSFYTVEVSKRGALTYSAEDVEAGNVHQSLSSY